MHIPWKTVLYVVAGGVIGFGMQKLVGCPTGGCPLMRTAWTSITYGAIMGLLMSFI
jgi:hypothetical protein